MPTLASPHAGRAATVFLPPDRATLLADALHCIVTGRALPEELRPRPVTIAPAVPVAETLARISGAPSADFRPNGARRS